MFKPMVHLASGMAYVGCYLALARHAHAAAPETCIVYWVLAFVGLIHFLKALRTTWKRWKWYFTHKFVDSPSEPNR